MITRIEWTESMYQRLARALSKPTLRIIEQEVNRGVSMLWHCKDDTHEAYCVTRVDNNPTEFVVVAFEGTGMLTFGPHFVKAAHSRGIPVRAHTASPVVFRLLRRLGLTMGEMVARSKVAA